MARELAFHGAGKSARHSVELISLVVECFHVTTRDCLDERYVPLAAEFHELLLSDGARIDRKVYFDFETVGVQVRFALVR